MALKWNLFRNPTLRSALESLFNITDGHDHDGVNSKTLSPAAVIGAGSVGTAAMINASVTADKLAANAVITAKILDANVTADKLAANAVTTSKILNDNVTNDKLANITRGSIKVGGAADAPTDLAAKDSGKILVGDGTDLKSVAVSGDVTLSAAGAVSIGAGKVTSAMLATTTSVGTKAIAAATGAAIPVTGSGILPLTIADAAETNTLAVPTFAGQELTIASDTLAGAGTRAITAATDIDTAGNNVITFTAAGQMVVLRGIKLGATFAWRLVANDGATLS